MQCRELTERAIERLTGEPGQPGAQELESHLAACADCRTELARLEETWSILGIDPDAEVSVELRARTLDLMEDELTRQRIRALPARGRTARWITRAVLQAAAILLAAGAGWLAHRPSAAAAAGDSAKAAVAGDPAGATLSHIAFQPADERGRVAVSFDMTTRRTVVGPPADPAVANLLAYLVSRETQTSGEKAQAIEAVSSHYGSASAPVSSEIVRALTTTLKRDQNPGVRKKAADALAGFPMTSEIRSALLDALANDRNPAVRLIAVDVLASAARKSPDPRTIESLREKASDASENGFVRAKAASALKAMDF